MWILEALATRDHHHNVPSLANSLNFASGLWDPRNILLLIKTLQKEVKEKKKKNERQRIFGYESMEDWTCGDCLLVCLHFYGVLEQISSEQS